MKNISIVTCLIAGMLVLLGTEARAETNVGVGAELNAEASRQHVPSVAERILIPITLGNLRVEPRFAFRGGEKGTQSFYTGGLGVSYLFEISEKTTIAFGPYGSYISARLDVLDQESFKLVKDFDGFDAGLAANLEVQVLPTLALGARLAAELERLTPKSDAIPEGASSTPEFERTQIVGGVTLRWALF